MFFVVIIEENRIYVDEKGKPYKTAGKIDYVAGWYYKAAKLMQNTPIHTAFVSTNSITQGEQVAGVWKPLYDQFGIHIDFAHRTFRWTVRLMRKLMCICRESPFTVRHFTVLKLGGEQLKKVEVLRLQRLLRSASTLWKD